jgi:hypothetical protein
MKKNIVVIALMMLMVACSHRKNSSDYYPQSDSSFQYESEEKEPDSVIQDVLSKEPVNTESSSNSSSRKEKELDNMRGFDPASEDDMDDNGMQRYFDANDDEAWD